PAGQYLIARGARMARRMDSDLYVVHVDRELATLHRESNPHALAANLRFAESLGAKVIRLKGKSVADAVAAFVRSKHITQVIFGRAPLRDWRKYLYLSAVHRLLRESPAVEAVHGGEIKVFPPVTQGSPSKDDLRNVLGANKSGHGVRNAFSFQANHFRAQAFCETQVGRQRVWVGLAMEGSKLAVDVDHV